MIVEASIIFQSATHIASLCFVDALLILSLLSLFLILRLRSRHFNSLWTVRLLLVSLVSLWALSHLLLLPYTRLCKLHLLLSFGLFQPAFLITVIYLLNASVKTPNSSALSVVFSTSLPVLTLQALALYLPDILSMDKNKIITAHCAYPPLSTLVFAVFGICFLIFFLSSCCKVMSVVINNGLRVRIYVLAITISISLSTEIMFLGISTMWRPIEVDHTWAEMVVFLSALSCAVAGEGLLVIIPIADALDAGGGDRYGQSLFTGKQRRGLPEVVEDRDKDMNVFL